MIRVDSLTKRHGSRTSVDSVNFEVPAGEVVGLLGPNGAGKTTVLKMLVGLTRPTHGTAEVLGCPVGSAGFAGVARRLGGLIESPALYPELTVRRNLDLQARAMRVDGAERTSELLELVDLAERAESRAGTLSLGMKQRLGIAIAMVATPEIVILDEPANGLDPAGIVEIRSLLGRLPAMGTTVLVSSHQLTEVQQACDRLIVMTDGRVVANGTTADILRGFAGNRFAVRLDPADFVAAQRCLADNALPFDTSAVDASLAVTLPDHLTGRDLNRVLSRHDIHAIEVRQESATLEEAFLSLTSADLTETTSAKGVDHAAR